MTILYKKQLIYQNFILVKKNYQIRSIKNEKQYSFKINVYSFHFAIIESQLKLKVRNSWL
jgi:hypothetical protein